MMTNHGVMVTGYNGVASSQCGQGADDMERLRSQLQALAGAFQAALHNPVESLLQLNHFIVGGIHPASRRLAAQAQVDLCQVPLFLLQARRDSLLQPHFQFIETLSPFLQLLPWIPQALPHLLDPLLALPELTQQ